MNLMPVKFLVFIHERVLFLNSVPYFCLTNCSRPVLRSCNQMMTIVFSIVGVMSLSVVGTSP